MSSQFIFRKIRATDICKQHLRLLSKLSPSSEDITLSPTEYTDYVEYINQRQETYYIVVIEDPVKQIIVGSGTLMVEHKLLHDLGTVGHIEDVVIDDEYRGHGLGKQLMERLKNKAKEMGCYKLILNCKEENCGFYEKCGYSKNEIEMRQNINSI